MRFMTIGCLVLALGAMAYGQSPAPATRRPEPIRLRIRHADPWFVKAMLEGIEVRSPEMSTITGFAGLGSAANAVNRFLGSGKLIVNPTDNSLWFYPDP